MGTITTSTGHPTRKDYEDRRRRQMQGQAKAKAEGKYVGRPEYKRRNARIAAMLTAPHILHGHTEGHGMQPRHRRQGRQACWGFAAELTDIKRAQTRFKDFWR